MSALDNHIGAPTRYGKAKRAAEIGTTPTATFLTLSIAWGPNRACFVITIVAIAARCFALCCRFPVVALSSPDS